MIQTDWHLHLRFVLDSFEDKDKNSLLQSCSLSSTKCKTRCRRGGSMFLCQQIVYVKNLIKTKFTLSVLNKTLSVFIAVTWSYMAQNRPRSIMISINIVYLLSVGIVWSCYRAARICLSLSPKIDFVVCAV